VIHCIAEQKSLVSIHKILLSWPSGCTAFSYIVVHIMQVFHLN